MESSGVLSFRLPPLILHPFSTPEDTSVLMDSSRANLALHGFLPQEESPADDLDRKLLRGRYAELRMLFYIGKDLTRWTGQCTEAALASRQFENRRIRPETFAVLLVQQVPPHVRTKLEQWGVLDFSALFRRSIGLHAVFSDLPAVNALNADFLRRYHRHLDQWYEYRLRESTYDRPEPGDFIFDLYASGEYTLMLEESWSKG
ncbi:MAG TPA: hypothetical protein VH351_16880 [Bryobacteraceae bacterium]|jgi:hypothetical protein|nr:hypothetical protein [Bryobacteraceae bacterium]